MGRADGAGGWGRRLFCRCGVMVTQVRQGCCPWRTCSVQSRVSCKRRLWAFFLPGFMVSRSCWNRR